MVGLVGFGKARYLNGGAVDYPTDPMNLMSSLQGMLQAHDAIKTNTIPRASDSFSEMSDSFRVLLGQTKGPREGFCVRF